MRKVKHNKNFIEYEQKIVNAFIRLVSKKGMDVTVAELIKEADITRPTFYLHFKTMQDVFKALEKQIIDQYMGFYNFDYKTYVNNLLDVELGLIKEIRKNKDFFANIAKSHYAGTIVHDIALASCKRLSNNKILNQYYSKVKGMVAYCDWLDDYVSELTHLGILIAKLTGNINCSWELLAYWMTNYYYKKNGQFWKKIGVIDKDRDFLKEYFDKYGDK